MNVIAAYGLLAHSLIFGALISLLPLGQLRARAALLAPRRRDRHVMAIVGNVMGQHRLLTEHIFKKNRRRHRRHS